MTNILDFIDPLTRDYRATPPTTAGHALDEWEQRRAQFIERWEAKPATERERLLDAAITEGSRA